MKKLGSTVTALQKRLSTSNPIIQKPMAPQIARRKIIAAHLIDYAVLAMLITIGVALLFHQQNLDDDNYIYFESTGLSTAPYWVRDSKQVPPTFFLETLRVQKLLGILNPAAMVVKTKTLTTFTFNQSYESFPEVKALVSETPKQFCFGATSGSGYGHCRMPAATALAALKRFDFVPASLLAQVEADLKANPLYKNLVFGGYGYSVQTDFSVEKLAGGNPDVAISLSACVEGDAVEVVNGYGQVKTSECMNYGNIKTYDLQFVSCMNATFAQPLHKDICSGMVSHYGRGMVFQAKIVLHTGEMVHGMNGILVPRDGSAKPGVMLIPSSAYVSVEDIANSERIYTSVRAVGVRNGIIAAISSVINIVHYDGVSFVVAAMLQMLVVMLTLRMTRRHSQSMIDTLTIYNRLGSSIIVFAQLVYCGYLANGLSYGVARLSGFKQSLPILVMEICLYTLNCLIWHHALKKGLGKQAVTYRWPVLIALPVILGWAGILYRTVTTIRNGTVFDDKQNSGAVCQLPSKFCYQTSYHKTYKTSYIVFPLVVNALLYLPKFLKTFFGFPIRQNITPELLPFEMVYGRRRVTSICSDYEYNYIWSTDFHASTTANKKGCRPSMFDRSPYLVNVSDAHSHPKYLATVEAVELCGFLFLNQSTIIRQKDVLIAFLARFIPYTHVSLVVWFCNGTQISQPMMLSGEDFRALSIAEGFFNYAGSPLGGLLKLDLDDIMELKTIFPSIKAAAGVSTTDKRGIS